MSFRRVSRKCSVTSTGCRAGPARSLRSEAVACSTSPCVPRVPRHGAPRSVFTHSTMRNERIRGRAGPARLGTRLSDHAPIVPAPLFVGLRATIGTASTPIRDRRAPRLVRSNRSHSSFARGQRSDSTNQQGAFEMKRIASLRPSASKVSSTKTPPTRCPPSATYSSRCTPAGSPRVSCMAALHRPRRPRPCADHSGSRPNRPAASRAGSCSSPDRAVRGNAGARVMSLLHPLFGTRKPQRQLTVLR